MNYDHVTPPLFEKEESTKMVITLTDDNISTDYLKEELTKQRHELLSILETKYTIILKAQGDVNAVVTVAKEDCVTESISSPTSISSSSPGVVPLPYQQQQQQQQ